MLHFHYVENGEGILGLCKCETIHVLMKFNTKEKRRRSKIFEAELIFELGDKVVDLRKRWSNDEDVVHVDENVERACSGVI